VAANAINPDGILWVTSNSGVPSPPADSLPNATFINDPAVISDKRLDSPTIAIPLSSGAQVTFRQNRDLESTFDGGVLEISIAGGAFQDILAAGGSFATGGYNATISTAFGSPIAGRQAWSGASGGFITSTANLPAAAAGQNIVLRWRMGSDNSVSHTGWRVDNVTVTSGYVCCTSPAEVISTPTTPSGPASGSTGTNYTYSTGGSTSNLGHPVQYKFNWGDGSASVYLPVGTTSAQHSWTSPGTYLVTSRAHCSIHTSVVSNLSNTFSVTIAP
jgi:hypothetical protein